MIIVETSEFVATTKSKCDKRIEEENNNVSTSVMCVCVSASVCVPYEPHQPRKIITMYMCLYVRMNFTFFFDDLLFFEQCAPRGNQLLQLGVFFFLFLVA